MENVASALRMAATILVFIIAIGASFSLFGTAKQTADSIIGMRDKQAYLDSAEVDNGILYTSSEAVTSGNIEGVNTQGDRIVSIDDVVSTILRYNKEKYGVTIIKKNGDNGEVLARFDSATEEKIKGATVAMFNSDYFEKYGNKVLNNIQTTYCKNITFPSGNILNLYKIENLKNTNFKYGAPWNGNDEQIQKRIASELTGYYYECEGQSFQREKGLFDTLEEKTIIEVTNEIDNSKYLENLLQEYQMPTVEVIYIIIDN